jgi:hypothetical protein
MITLKDYMEAVNYQITESDPYLWSNYGKHAQTFSSWNGSNDHHGWSVGCVFDRENQTVYEMTVCDYHRTRAYRWINPVCRDKLYSDKRLRGFEKDYAWDTTEWCDLEISEDILEKTKAIVSGNEYDTRIMVSINLTDKELFQAMKLAHEQDITFNQFVANVLMMAIESEIIS